MNIGFIYLNYDSTGTQESKTLSQSLYGYILSHLYNYVIILYIFSTTQVSLMGLLKPLPSTNFLYAKLAC